MKKSTRDWIKKAESDLETAKYNFEGGKKDVALFFSHQVIEKALKALSIEHEGDYPYSHNLVRLSRGKDISDEMLRVFADLNPVYTSFRYPDEEPPEFENPEEVLEKTERFLKWTKRQLEE